jgi:hypothetical protein
MKDIKEMKRLFYSRKSGKVTLTFEDKQGETFIVQMPFQEAVDKKIIGNFGLVEKL